MTRGLSTWISSVALAAVCIASLPAHGADQGPCVPANAQAASGKGKNRLVIGTGNAGGVYFPYGGGIARIVSAKLARTEMTAELTGGSVDNEHSHIARTCGLACTINARPRSATLSKRRLRSRCIARSMVSHRSTERSGRRSWSGTWAPFTMARMRG